MKRTKWAWYLLLSGIAVTFAEGFSWSTPFIFIPAGWLTWLFYALHYILFFDYLARRRAITLKTLLAAGLVLGFVSESIFTKVIWNPPWDEGETLRVLGLGVYEVGFIVMVWHAWMSLAIPVGLTVSHYGCTEVFTPRQTRRILWLLPLTMCYGIVLNSLNPLLVIAAMLVNFGGIGVLMIWYRRALRRRPIHDLDDLLLTRGEKRLVWTILLAFYGLGLTFRPDAYPAPLPFMLGMLLVWSSMRLLGMLRRVEMDRMVVPHPFEPASPARLFRYTVYFIAFVSVFLLVNAVLNVIIVSVAIGFSLVMILVGIGYFLRLGWNARRQIRQLAPIAP